MKAIAEQAECKKPYIVQDKMETAAPKSLASALSCCA
jgi:hypothetical protein